ncbi:MAG: hypothetical protein HFACDABA_00374 [Anaerolineales bacterium]|nr:hypothetical protein [Anaerolineales bacterium]
MNLFEALWSNHVLIGALAGWLIAQGLKAPIEYLATRKWRWSAMLSAGGMPSSHSALMVSTTLGVGLHVGFDVPEFAIAVAITMIVVYDAAGVRRQAGMHAERINVLFDELMRGHMWSEKDLREVIGHSPLEVAGGILLGLIVGVVNWMIFT